MCAAVLDFDVLVNGVHLADAAVVAITVDRALDQPAMCVVTIRNQRHEHTNKYALGAPVEIAVGGFLPGTIPAGGKTAVFKGELVGLEPHYAPGDGVVRLRAFDRLHRLTRGRKSATFEDQSDQHIVNAVASKHGLSAETGSTPTIRHSHVFQHNQTDLEFILERARALGFSVWCEDTKMYFSAPRLDTSSGLEFVLAAQIPPGALRLTDFSAQLSNARVVKKVTVRGRNPDTGMEILGEAKAGASSPLGSVPAAATLGSFGHIDAFTVDHPIFSAQEASALAKARLDELSMSFLTAEAEAMGHPSIKPGIVVTVVVNQGDPHDRFNGSYLVRGCSHRIDSRSTAGTFITTMRLERDAERG